MSKEEADAELFRDEPGRLACCVEDREGELRFVSNISGERPSPGNLALARLGIFFLNLRGWKHYPAARLNTRSHVDFRRESDNEYDFNTVADLCDLRANRYSREGDSFEGVYV